MYQEISKKDKERYGNEMKEYRARQRIGMPGTARIDPNADTSNADTNPNVWLQQTLKFQIEDQLHDSVAKLNAVMGIEFTYCIVYVVLGVSLS